MTLNHKSQSGFSLIELTVVLAIVAMVASLATVNSSSIKVRQESAKFVSVLRRAQSLALSGSGIKDNEVCGYGVHYVNDGEYLIFEGRSSSGLQCALTQRKYKDGIDRVVERFNVSAKAIVVEQFKDIFFEPPDPKIYFDDVSNFGEEAKISIRRSQDQQCSQSIPCAGVVISTSGRIEISNIANQR